MRLGLFMMPLHPPTRDYHEMLEEDLEAVLHADRLGFDIRAFEQLRARFSATARAPSSAGDAYAVLGLPRSASDDAIRRTYRNLVREHHPDRLVAKGMPEEMVEQANKVLAAINAAYDRIAKERKLR